MDKNTDDYTSGVYLGMGIQESSEELLSLAELERVISRLIDDDVTDYNPTPIKPPTVNDVLLSEQTDYFRNLTSQILESKKNFFTAEQLLNQNIEFMINQFNFCVKTREREFREKLLRIKETQVQKWNQQLSLCNSAIQQLDAIRKSGNRYLLESFPKDQIMEQLHSLESSTLSVDLRNFYLILDYIQNFGSLMWHVYPSLNASSAESSKGVKFTFGGPGINPGQLCRPWGICSDATGRVLVCDRCNNRLQIFDSHGNFLIQFGKEGSKPGEFNRPSGVDVDAKSRIIVADKDNHRIQIFTYHGRYLFNFGSQGKRPGEFQYPWDVSVNNKCQIAVSDSKNHRVQLFDDKGRFILMFNPKQVGISSPRSAMRLLDSPRGLAFRADGSLYVTDLNNNHILLISSCFKQVRVIGCEGNGTGQFFRPQGITCDNAGRVAISDSKNYRVQVYDSAWNLLQSFGKQGSKLGEFDCPQGITFHPNNNLLVVDLNNHRVQVF